MTATLTYDEKILRRRRGQVEATASSVQQRKKRFIVSSVKRGGDQVTFVRNIGYASPHCEETSDSSFAFFDIEEETKNAFTTMPSVSTQVSTIIEAFSLTISQAARVLGVTRPTVYAWKKSEDACNAERSDHQRLMKIYGLADQWNRFGLGPLGERAHVPFISDHRSIIGLLSVDSLDITTLAEVERRLQLLADKDRDVVLVGEKAARWRAAIGSTPPSMEVQESNLENNLRALRDGD